MSYLTPTPLVSVTLTGPDGTAQTYQIPAREYEAAQARLQHVAKHYEQLSARHWLDKLEEGKPTLLPGDLFQLQHDFDRESEALKSAIKRDPLHKYDPTGKGLRELILRAVAAENDEEPFLRFQNDVYDIYRSKSRLNEPLKLSFDFPTDELPPTPPPISPNCSQVLLNWLKLHQGHVPPPEALR